MTYFLVGFIVTFVGMNKGLPFWACVLLSYATALTVHALGLA